jgi:hypothetical protein
LSGEDEDEREDPEERALTFLLPRRHLDLLAIILSSAGDEGEDTAMAGGAGTGPRNRAQGSELGERWCSIYTEERLGSRR